MTPANVLEPKLSKLSVQSSLTTHEKEDLSGTAELSAYKWKRLLSEPLPRQPLRAVHLRRIALSKKSHNLYSLSRHKNGLIMAILWLGQKIPLRLLFLKFPRQCRS